MFVCQPIIIINKAFRCYQNTIVVNIQETYSQITHLNRHFIVITVLYSKINKLIKEAAIWKPHKMEAPAAAYRAFMMKEVILKTHQPLYHVSCYDFNFNGPLLRAFYYKEALTALNASVLKFC